MNPPGFDVRADSIRWARTWFAVQAGSGAIWWVLIVTSDAVRSATLGSWSPTVVALVDVPCFVGLGAIAATGRRWAGVVSAGWTVLVTVALGVTALLDREAGWGAVLMTIAAVAATAAAATLWSGRLPTRWFFVGPFRFRPAPVASRRRNLTLSLAQLVVFWSTFLVAVPILLDVLETRLRLAAPFLDGPLVGYVGGVLLVVGSAFGLWSCITMARIGRGTPLPAVTARELVVAGPYRIVRNPMAVAGATQTVGVGLIVGAWSPLVAALAGTAFWHVVIRPVEEADLATRFGAAYAEYRSAVRCWVPRARPAERGGGPGGP